ncbi:hypothetical protein [Massilia sp.]|uniref:hypothetical protein n=1 Tax=Massilia sp. TaxID=1882437 RepID=UPI00391A3CE7
MESTNYTPAELSLIWRRTRKLKIAIMAVCVQTWEKHGALRCSQSRQRSKLILCSKHVLVTADKAIPCTSTCIPYLPQ